MGLIAILEVAVGAIALFVLVFRSLTPRQLAWGDHHRGAVMATVGWLVLRVGGAIYADRVVARGSLKGTLARSPGLLAFLYAAAYLPLPSAGLSEILWERRTAEGSGQRRAATARLGDGAGSPRSTRG